MCSMMFKQRKNFKNNIFWNAQHNLREKGLKNILDKIRCMSFGLHAFYVKKLV